ncbi:MAG: exodeoxyribonuclease VII large subunit [Candidatus Omnitrophota bacterium]
MDPTNASHLRTFGASPASMRKVYTVTELNQRARGYLEAQFSGIWLEGEISNLKKHTSGHIYLSLKDETSQISAVFFSRYNDKIRFELKDGLQVLVYGKVSLYDVRGQYQFYVERMEPKGLGALQLAFLQLKEKLEKEGLFRADRKKPIPKYPNVVGVVTSPTGAAIRDILNVIGRRFHGTQVLIYPVRVQGEGAAEEIAQGILAMQRVGGIEVLIVGRGGGSIEDLWAFNEEKVARAVYGCSIPVISAVGHEIDFTICDMVADLRAPTPSAAAELVVQNREALEERLADDRGRMEKALRSLLDYEKQHLERLTSTYAFQQPALLIDGFSQRLDELARQLQNYWKAFVASRKQAFEAFAGKLNALSPLAVLGRGYSITFDKEGRPVKEIRGLRSGDILRTRLWKGDIESKITGIEPPKGA